jgi:hypothetical protein
MEASMKIIKFFFNIINIILLSVVFVMHDSSSCFSQNNPIPSENDIIKWYHADDSVEDSDEHITFVNMDNIKKIFLRNREKAFVTSVEINPRRVWKERNSTVMIRPIKKQTREMGVKKGSGSFTDIGNVYDFDHDGVSEVELSFIWAAQGTSGTGRYLVQFDGWKPIILHEAQFSENTGCCGDEEGSCDECHYEDVSWKFVDLDGDGVDDLVEEMTTKQGPSEDKLTTTKNISYYLFKNKKFIKVDDTSKLHLP